VTAPSLHERISEITTRNPDPGLNYYAITVLGKEDGNMSWSCYSHWERWANIERRVELRAASIVRAERIAELWRNIGESCAVVNSCDDMEIFLLIGGNGLVEKSVAEAVVKDWLAPQPVAPSGAAGFVHVETLPKGAQNRAPTPKQRMQILKRDGHRCRICGRRATDYVDIELHVHHIRPWAEGGFTEDANLITLCHTCHNGLEPHFDRELYELLAPADSSERDKKRAKEHWRGVELYRKRVVQEFSRGSSDGT